MDRDTNLMIGMVIALTAVIAMFAYQSGVIGLATLEWVVGADMIASVGRRALRKVDGWVDQVLLSAMYSIGCLLFIQAAGR